MPEPILVMCMGRSGSSMTTEIIARHGAWTGKCLGPDHKNPRGYWENKRIKKEVVNRCGQQVNRIAPFQAGWREFVEQVLTTEGYRGGPWVVKHFAAFWQLWEEFDPVWVLPRRDSEAIFRSVRKAKFNARYDDDELRRIITMHQDQLDYIRDHRGGVEVDTRAVVSGDYTTIRRAVEASGFTWDPSIVDEVVNPDFWHQEKV